MAKCIFFHHCVGSSYRVSGSTGAKRALPLSEAGMAATVWKGYITFGLISIPVRLFAAARNERVSFHQLHQVCNTRIKQHLYCPTCDRDVERSEIVRGYE